MANRRGPKGTPTHTNLFALRSLFGDRTFIPNQMHATDVPHLRRCLKAGLVRVEGGGKLLALTPEGAKAIGRPDAGVTA